MTDEPEPVVIMWINVEGRRLPAVHRWMRQVRDAFGPTFEKAGWKHVLMYSTNTRPDSIEVVTADEAERVRLKEIEAEVLAQLAELKE